MFNSSLQVQEVAHRIWPLLPWGRPHEGLLCPDRGTRWDGHRGAQRSIICPSVGLCVASWRSLNCTKGGVGGVQLIAGGD